MTTRPKEVPEAWKHPVGPYRQAPPEYGGEWWLVNPFSGPEPWLLLDREPPAAEVLPEGFTAIFGEKPEKKDYPTRSSWSLAVLQWDQDRKNFERAGTPPWASEKQLQLATDVLVAWGLGKPVFYEHSDWSWMARFPESESTDFDMNAHTAIVYTHLVVANYQIRLMQEGITPETRHPLLGGV